MTNHVVKSWWCPRLRFSLRFWFACISLICVLLSLIGYEVARSQGELRVANSLRANGADFRCSYEFVGIGDVVPEHHTVQLDPSVLCARVFPSVAWIGLRNDHRIDNSVFCRLSQFGRLKALQIEFLDMSEREISAVSDLKSVAELSITDVPIKDDGLKRICSGMRLKFLEVSRCEITNAGLAHLHPLKDSLIELHLHGREFSDRGVGHLRDLSKLQVLSLDGTSLTDKGVQVICNLKGIDHLSLADTPITDKSMDFISELPKLVALNLDNTRISDACLGRIAMLRQLQSVRLYGSDVTKDGIDRFRRMAPTVDVEF